MYRAVIGRRNRWARDKKIGNRMIKPRRCLVLANGLYEWQKLDAFRDGCASDYRWLLC